MRRSWVLGGFGIALLLAAFGIALFARPFASSAPDGMGRVAINEGFDHTEKANPVKKSSPVGGYAVKGVSNAKVSTGLAGAIGVALTLLIGTGIFIGLRRAGRAEQGRRAPDGHRMTT
jgi:cobalt/nickel transport system permease protein